MPINIATQSRCGDCVRWNKSPEKGLCAACKDISPTAQVSYFHTNPELSLANRRLKNAGNENSHSQLPHGRLYGGEDKRGDYRRGSGVPKKPFVLPRKTQRHLWDKVYYPQGAEE